MFCDKCGGTGVIVWFDEKGKCMSKKCECYDVEIARQRIEKSGMIRTKIFKNFKQETNKQKSAYQTCISYTPDQSLLLLGQVGAGKTHLCMAIGNKLLDEGIPVVYMDYRRVINELKFNITDREYVNTESRRYINAKVLIIDDFFKGGSTEAEIRIMYEIIDQRYKQNLSFIISSEYPLQKLMQIDEAIASRIAERANGNVIDFGVSKRDNYRMRG